jgi:hypothetical protein
MSLRRSSRRKPRWQLGSRRERYVSSPSLLLPPVARFSPLQHSPLLNDPRHTFSPSRHTLQFFSPPSSSHRTPPFRRPELSSTVFRSSLRPLDRSDGRAALFFRFGVADLGNGTPHSPGRPVLVDVLFLFFLLLSPPPATFLLVSILNAGFGHSTLISSPSTRYLEPPPPSLRPQCAPSSQP